jgi:hypothetical protein
VAACNTVDAGALEEHAGGQEVAHDAQVVEHLQGPAPDDEGLGLVGRVRIAVDDAAGQAVAVQVGGHGQADWPGADDQGGAG